MQKNARMKKELEQLEKCPPPGAHCWPVDGAIDHLEAILFGPQDSPYEGGSFKVEIRIPDRYPFEPPKVEMKTRVYHPNIDDVGRICLDILKMPPTGGWRPSINLYTVLTSLQRLLAEPNPKDPLMVEIASEFEMNINKYKEKARQMTRQYAMENEENDHNDNSKAISGGKRSAAATQDSHAQKRAKS